ncbi:hypothetical protein G7Y89_g10044 [Cudoniella acicularis]|uniref:Uncharacterized protein n=1 Tax=Cudoniella acicularis TaxID=354080 RepID=A0A8H4VZ41_9HELO|nr:hypothetical protein G7Y89_g10044 [Cudoniella acicularis]
MQLSYFRLRAKADNIIQKGDFIFVNGNIYYVAALQEVDSVTVPVAVQVPVTVAPHDPQPNHPDATKEQQGATEAHQEATGVNLHINSPPQHGNIKIVLDSDNNLKATIDNNHAFFANFGVQGLPVDHNLSRLTGINLIDELLARTSPDKVLIPNIDLKDDLQAAGRAAAFMVNSQSPLLSLPNELKDRILNQAVIVDGDLTPRQIKTRSNKFFWNDSQKPGPGNRRVPPLAAVALSRTCKQLYNEVAGTDLLYKHNKFNVNDREFSYFGSLDPLNYFFAITEKRLSSIRTLSILWSKKWSVKEWKTEFFTVLRSMGHLENLEIRMQADLSRWNINKYNYKRAYGFKDMCLAVKGLKSLTFLLLPVTELFRDETRHWMDDAAVQKMADDTAEVAVLLQEALEQHIGSHERKVSLSVRSKFLELMSYADLDVLGEGRLGEDRKPGVVASRTRAQRRKYNEEV